MSPTYSLCNLIFCHGFPRACWQFSDLATISAYPQSGVGGGLNIKLAAIQFYYGAVLQGSWKTLVLEIWVQESRKKAYKYMSKCKKLPFILEGLLVQWVSVGSVLQRLSKVLDRAHSQPYLEKSGFETWLFCMLCYVCATPNPIGITFSVMGMLREVDFHL